MLGVLVLRLRVKVGGHYSMFPGKLLHGAVFRYLSAHSPALANELHARQTKPFTIGFFRRAEKKPGTLLRAQEVVTDWLLLTRKLSQSSIFLPKYMGSLTPDTLLS